MRIHTVTRPTKADAIKAADETAANLRADGKAVTAGEPHDVVAAGSKYGWTAIDLTVTDAPAPIPAVEGTVVLSNAASAPTPEGTTSEASPVNDNPAGTPAPETVIPEAVDTPVLEAVPSGAASPPATPETALHRDGNVLLGESDAEESEEAPEPPGDEPFTADEPFKKPKKARKAKKAR